MNKVLDHLFIGGVYDLRLPQTISEYPVDTLIRLYEQKPGYPAVPYDLFAFDYPAPDGGVWPVEFFGTVTSHIARLIEDGNTVAVLCAAGKSRSATIVLAYLCTYSGMTLQQAWKHLKQVRPVVDPNLELIVSLVKFLGVHPYLSTLIGE